jgi:hypothetical protein
VAVEFKLLQRDHVFEVLCPELCVGNMRFGIDEGRGIRCGFIICARRYGRLISKYEDKINAPYRADAL